MEKSKKKLQDILKKARYSSSSFNIKDHLVYKAFGTDCIDFFSNQVTSNSNSLMNMSFQESAIVDPKGRLVCSFLLLKESEDCFYLSFDKAYETNLLDRLNLFLISEDVEFKKTNLNLSVGLNLIDDTLYRGSLFGGIECSISFKELELAQIDKDELKILRFCSGKSLMGLHLYPGELITNTFLSRYAIDYNKGCYPGQETISKVHNNKGASLFPVALVGVAKILSENISSFDKKIGSVREILKIGDNFYHYSLMNRENQVEGKQIEIEGNTFLVQNFPLIDNSKSSLVEEVFDEAVFCFQNGKDEEAKSLLKHVISIDPTYSDAYESLGVILGREKHFEEAIEVMKKLVEVNPTTVMGHTNLSMYYMQLGDKETAEKYKADATLKQFEQFGIEADKKRFIETQENQKKLEKEQRESMFIQVLEIDPEDALANFGLGELELERENFEKSIEHLKIAINTDPRYSVAYLALGKAYFSIKDISSAKSTFDAGISIASKNGDLMPANEMQLILNQC
jgi:folate-binding protein YgfZ